MVNIEVQDLQQAIEYGIDLAKTFEETKGYVDYKDVLILPNDIDFTLDQIDLNLKIIKYDNEDHAIDIINSAKEYNLLLVANTYLEKLFTKALLENCLVLSTTDELDKWIWMSYNNKKRVLNVDKLFKDFLPASNTILSIKNRN